jgi:predicted DNA-binding transcriptional regulator AlpA
MSDTDNTPSARIPVLPDIRNLPAMLTIPTAAGLLGISRATGYRLAAADNLPVPVVTVGNSLRVPAAPLLALLGLTPAPDPATAAESGTGAPDAGGAAAPAATAPDL